jgi:hypothetical protein
MNQGQFANQRALIEYAEAHDLAYAWQGSPTFAKRWRLAQIAQPGQYELVEDVSFRQLRTCLPLSLPPLCARRGHKRCSKK